MDTRGHAPVIGSGEHAYRWIDEWAVVPDGPAKAAASVGFTNGGRTHGVVVTEDGVVIVLHAADPAVLIYNHDGHLVRSWGHGWHEGAHGLTLVNEDGVEYLWLTEYVRGMVVKTSLDGVVLQELETPPAALGYSADLRYKPTWVAVDEPRFGGDGTIWVADGYGASLVHRYDRSGEYRDSLDGSRAAGRFACPHAVFIDRRGGEPELLVSDRTNRRIQVFDLDGGYKRTFGEGTSVCAFDARDGFLYCAEAPYRARVSVFDPNDRLVVALGANDAVCSAEGFPNDRRNLRAGSFNSPHAVASDRDANLYVVEWITGGRITKLEKIGRP